MKYSQTITKLSVSLVEAQKEIGSAVKGSTNPYFKSKYADLPAVIDACKEALNKHGIAILQPVEGDKVTTMLVHESGEWMQDEGTPIICTKQNDPQAQGSAITYARRYGLSSMLLIPADDDDGEGATNHSDAPSMGEITRTLEKVKKLKELYPDNERLDDIIKGLEEARLAKRSLTKEYLLKIKDGVDKKLQLHTVQK